MSANKALVVHTSIGVGVIFNEKCINVAATGLGLFFIFYLYNCIRAFNLSINHFHFEEYVHFVNCKQNHVVSFDDISICVQLRYINIGISTCLISFKYKLWST